MRDAEHSMVPLPRSTRILPKQLGAYNRIQRGAHFGVTKTEFRPSGMFNKSGDKCILRLGQRFAFSMKIHSAAWLMRERAALSLLWVPTPRAIVQTRRACSGRQALRSREPSQFSVVVAVLKRLPRYCYWPTSWPRVCPWPDAHIAACSGHWCWTVAKPNSARLAPRLGWCLMDCSRPDCLCRARW